jgi:hypothetical protein
MILVLVQVAQVNGPPILLQQDVPPPLHEATTSAVWRVIPNPLVQYYVESLRQRNPARASSILLKDVTVI